MGHPEEGKQPEPRATLRASSASSVEGALTVTVRAPGAVGRNRNSSRAFRLAGTKG